MPAWTSTSSAGRRTASLLAYSRASSEAAATQQGWIACGPLLASANNARKATRSLSRSASVMCWSTRLNVARYARAMKCPPWAAKNPSWILASVKSLVQMLGEALQNGTAIRLNRAFCVYEGCLFRKTSLFLYN